MIKMPYEKFMAFPFAQAFQKLAATPFDTKTAYQVKKLGEDFQSARDKIKGEYMALVNDYAKKDEKGEFIRPNGDPNAFDIEEAKMEEYKAAEGSFGKREITFDRLPIDVARLGDLKLSAGECSVLEGIVQFEAPTTGDATNVHPLKNA